MPYKQIVNIHTINPFVIRCGHYNGVVAPFPLELLLERRYAQWYEVELVIEGNGYIVQEGDRIELKKGRMFFRYPGMSIEPSRDYHSYYVVFDLAYDIAKTSQYFFWGNLEKSRLLDNEKPLAEEVERPFFYLDLPAYIDAIKFSEFEECFSALYNEYVYARKESPLIMKSYLLRILAQAFIEYSNFGWKRDTSKSNNLNFMKIMRVKDHIDKNIQKKFKLAELAELAELSTSCFCRTFKKIINESSFDYINRNKINKSKKMLIETNKPLKVIVSECGFENYAYFCTLFKKLEGTSPINYKKGHCLQFISF